MTFSRDLLIARSVGSAGTGKTTELQRIMEAALPGLGNDPLRLGFASFTRRARAEAVSRVSKAWGVDPSMLERVGWFRTVHSVCRRCLEVGSELVANSIEDKKWLAEAMGVPLSTEWDDETGTFRFSGDPRAAAALNCWGYARSTLKPLPEVARAARYVDDTLPNGDEIVRMVERYESRKRMDGRVDFTDLLSRFAGCRFDPREGAYNVTPEGTLPQVDAWLFDEQQDASPLLDLCCKRLVSSPTVRWCYVVGDPFQAIYGFAGSSAECFLAWPAKKERTMPKSYRCPKPILDLGEQCLRRMTKTKYWDRGVAPADHEGSVLEDDGIDAAVSAVDPRESWLFLARTNFQASRLKAALQAAKVPCRWAKGHDGPTARDEGMAALWTLEQDGSVTGQQWARAIELLPIKDKTGAPILARGTRTHWAERNPGIDHLFVSDIDKIGGGEPALVEAVRTGRWCGLVDDGERWREQAVRWGVELASRPRVLCGTIHSVKGAEADHVAFLTTTSAIVERGKQNPRQADEEHRLAYVAVTRTRRTLRVINESRPGRQLPVMEVL